jgi:hypothetical protein
LRSESQDGERRTSGAAHAGTRHVPVDPGLRRASQVRGPVFHSIYGCPKGPAERDEGQPERPAPVREAVS